jgi:F-type H+-transporting ATPase subunit epsilon
MSELKVEIISPKGYLFNDKCYLVTIPAVEGQIGVMENHEAVLANLIEGNITIFDSNNNSLKEIPVKSGFAEVFDNKLLVLVD